MCTVFATLAYFWNQFWVYRAESWCDATLDLLSGAVIDAAWPRFERFARSRQEGFVLVFICAGSWVAQASHQFLLFSGAVRLTWLVGSSGPSRRLHHQTLILLLLLTCMRELVNGTCRIRRLRRGQVYLNSRYAVWVGLKVVGLRVCRQDSTMISGTDLICIWYFIHVDDVRWWGGGRDQLHIAITTGSSTTQEVDNMLNMLQQLQHMLPYHFSLPFGCDKWQTILSPQSCHENSLVMRSQSVPVLSGDCCSQKFLILTFSEYFQGFSGN